MISSEDFVQKIRTFWVFKGEEGKKMCVEV